MSWKNGFISWSKIHLFFFTRNLNQQKISIGSGNGLASGSRQAITWTKVPKWGQISYKIKYIREHQIWYAIGTYSLRNIYSKFNSTTLSAYQDIHT